MCVLRITRIFPQLVSAADQRPASVKVCCKFTQSPAQFETLRPPINDLERNKTFLRTDVTFPVTQ